MTLGHKLLSQTLACSAFIAGLKRFWIVFKSVLNRAGLAIDRFFKSATNLSNCSVVAVFLGAAAFVWPFVATDAFELPFILDTSILRSRKCLIRGSYPVSFETI